MQSQISANIYQHIREEPKQWTFDDLKSKEFTEKSQTLSDVCPESLSGVQNHLGELHTKAAATIATKLTHSFSFFSCQIIFKHMPNICKNHTMEK